jgi:Heavy metal binding domain
MSSPSAPWQIPVVSVQPAGRGRRARSGFWTGRCNATSAWSAAAHHGREFVQLLTVPRMPILLALVVTLAAGLTAQKPPRTDLPPVSFTCPMHPDIIEDREGACPRCGMPLVPVRLDTAFSCPVHPSVIETGPGTCRICRRSLVQVTIALFWTCPGHSDIHELNPGQCPDGQARVSARERRAHGDHNPRHGGQFFMAPDNWHHLEGTYPRAGVFRLFLYDDFTRPLSLRGVTARAVTRETYDPETKRYIDVTAFPLAPAKTGRYLEAHVPAQVPAPITVKVKFAADGPEHRFDFSFSAYTNEPAPGAMPAVTPPLPQCAASSSAPG